MMRVLPAGVLSLAFAHLCAASALDLTPVKRWIALQDDFHTVTADFTQTRALRTLRNPLENEGRLWFKAPGLFRWELGSPAKLIVLRKGDVIFLIHPAKKRAERRASGAMNENAGAMGLGMMNIPFARDFASYQKDYETLAIGTEGTRCHLEMLPRDPRAHKALTALKLDFNTSNGHLLSFEMGTSDGSTLRSRFTNVQTNARINSSVFDFDFSGYDVVDAKP